MPLAILPAFSGNQARSWIKNNMMKLVNLRVFSIFSGVIIYLEHHVFSNSSFFVKNTTKTFLCSLHFNIF